MSITLNGTIVTDADTAADFTNVNSGANISGDDDNVEGTGAVGDKMSNTTEVLASDALLGGAAGVYDFSVGGADEGAHFIGWVNTKTPIDLTDGLAVYFANASGHLGTWNVIPAYFYKGGFTTRVINPSADFNAATTWTTTGNPAQLDDVSIMGFSIHTITSIMGSFNNCQVDQMCVGFGVRADAGTLGTPNTYQDVIDTDQDTNFWGWHSSVGAKGGLYIGPATGTTASWFVDSAFAIKFLDENVASGFYGLFIRGENTTCDFSLANISAENPTNSRWELELESTMGDTTGGFTDTNSTYTGSNIITLNSNASLTGTTIIDGTSLIQNGATLNGITVINPNILTTEHYLSCVGGDLDLLTDATFESNGVGHALEYAPTGAGPFDEDIIGGTFTGYAAQGGTAGDRALYINPVTSSADITINIIDGSAPSYRLAAGYTGTFTLVVNPVTTTVKVTDTSGTAIENARVLVEASAGTGDLPYQDAVTITQTAGVATVTHTGHGLVSNNYVVIRGADQNGYNKQAQITVTGANTYTYAVDSGTVSPATGSPTSTGVVISGLTSALGLISDTRTFSLPQPITGTARKSSASPYYQPGAITGTVSNTAGFSTTIQLLDDE